MAGLSPGARGPVAKGLRLLSVVQSSDHSSPEMEAPLRSLGRGGGMGVTGGGVTGGPP